MRKLIIIIILVALSFADYTVSNYDKLKDQFVNRKSYTFTGCYGLNEFCHKGYMHCRVDCKLMKSGYCTNYNMPHKLNFGKLEKCRG